MARPETKMTYEEFRRLPEGPPYYELIGGELLLSPSPKAAHQTIVLKLAASLLSFVSARGLGVVFVSPFDVILSNEDVVEPDVLFVAEYRRHVVLNDGVHGPPDLIVEVISTFDPDRERKRKRALYENTGVKEYWIIDPGAKTVEVLVHSGVRFEAVGVFDVGSQLRSQAVPGFQADLSDLFAPA